MKKKGILITLVSAVLLLIICGFAIYKYMAPSNVKREMSEQYKSLGKNQALVVVNNEVLKETGIIEGGQYYLPMDLVGADFNERLFFDSIEQKLCYVSPQITVQVPINSKEYLEGKSTKTAEYNILIEKDKKVYVALPFVQQYSAIEVKTYKNPSRVVAVTNFKDEFSFATLSGATRLRVGANKKYDYLLELEKGKKVIVDSSKKVENGYQKVMTEDGIVGYMPTDSFTSVVKDKWKTDKKEPEFEQITSDKKICLGWHQVTNQSVNSYLGSTIANAKGLNVVSPTWFALTDNAGNFSSLANANYVTQAHNAGVKVWGLINDFNKNIDLTKLLTATTSRQQLVNNIVAKAIQFNLDGINIDFERIKSKNAAAFLEFLRELSVKCSSNQLVLSVDNYMPANFNAYYNREEQGKVVDYVVFMGYDEHYAGSDAGSVSSISYITQGLSKIEQMIPTNRVIMALPFYTRLWKIKDGKTTSAAYGMDGAENALKVNGALAKWDQATAQYYAEWNKGGATFKIWLEEEKSLEEKMKATDEKGVAGLGFWKLGFERNSIWNVISKHLN